MFKAFFSYSHQEFITKASILMIISGAMYLDFGFELKGLLAVQPHSYNDGSNLAQLCHEVVHLAETKHKSDFGESLTSLNFNDQP